MNSSNNQDTGNGINDNSASGSSPKAQSKKDKWASKQPSSASINASKDDIQNQIDYSVYRLEPLMYGPDKDNITTVVDILKGCSKNFLKWKEEAKEANEDEFRYVLSQKQTYFAENFKNKVSTK